MGLVDPPWGPKVLFILQDLFLKVCYINFEINLLAMLGGPTRGLSRAPRGEKF